MARRLLAFVTVLALVWLVACGGPPPPPPPPPPSVTTSFEGKFGVAPEVRNPGQDLNSQEGMAPRAAAPSPLAALQRLGVDGLNEALLSGVGSRGTSPQSLEPPLRGVNARVLDRFLKMQRGEATLFDFQSIVAVDSSGKVLASAPVGADGSFSIRAEDIPTNTKVALAQAYKDDSGNWVCTNLLDFQEVNSQNRTVSTRPALFAVGESDLDLDLQKQPFNFNEASGDPASKADPSSLADPNINEDAYLKCDNPNLTDLPINADFDWTTDFEETILYDFGIMLGVDFSKTPERYLGVGTFDSDGVLNMNIRKSSAETIPLDVFSLDVCWVDAEKCWFPLLPTFDFNAALFRGAVSLKDEPYDYGIVPGQMAYLYGTLPQLPAGKNAEVYGILTDERILDYNFSLTRGGEGTYNLGPNEYELLLPATGTYSDGTPLTYYLFAIDEDDCIYFPDSLEPYGYDSSGNPLYWLPIGEPLTYNLTLVSNCYSANNPPTVTLSASPGSGSAPLDVTLTASASDPDGDPLSYFWDFDDGTTASTTGGSITHTYASAGTYTATVTVSDGTDTASTSVSVNVTVPNLAISLVNNQGRYCCSPPQLSWAITNQSDVRLTSLTVNASCTDDGDPADGPTNFSGTLSALELDETVTLTMFYQSGDSSISGFLSCNLNAFSAEGVVKIIWVDPPS